MAADAESAAQVFNDVHRLALDRRLTSYDAAYLELALRHRLPLATLDDELIRASKGGGGNGALLAGGLMPLRPISPANCKRRIKSLAPKIA